MSFFFLFFSKLHHHRHHLSFSCEGRWGTTDDFTTSFVHFSVFNCPLGLWKLQACPFPDVFPPLFLCAFSSSPFHCFCKMVSARPDEREKCSYHFSLRLFMIIRRSSCGPNCPLAVHLLGNMKGNAMKEVVWKKVWCLNRVVYCQCGLSLYLFVLPRHFGKCVHQLSQSSQQLFPHFVRVGHMNYSLINQLPGQHCS